ncbi:small serum protein 2-like, partial [Clarias magur]
RSVFVGFLLLALISVSHAACWHSKLEAGETYCYDSVDKTQHSVESHWKNSKCESCWCKEGFMRCCDG